jgi:hypothetical protein
LEIENICKEVLGVDNTDSQVIRHRVDEIDRKFDYLIKENKELKKFIELKTKGISKINTAMNLFRKEIANIKGRPQIKPKSAIKNTTFNKSNKFKKEKEVEELLRLGKAIFNLDTMEFLKKVKVDPKEVLYMPKKVITNDMHYNVPKLHISVRNYIN